MKFRKCLRRCGLQCTGSLTLSDVTCPLPRGIFRNMKLAYSTHRCVTVPVESQTEEVEQPLHEAARRGNLDFMRECLMQGVSGTGLDNAGNTPLYWASHAGHVDCVRELLSLPRPAVNVQVSDTMMGQLLLGCCIPRMAWAER
jgi:FOG: Ankyrin repeat